ncbi:MAG: XRE family transcriptional regulator [Erysipelotrichia bacterium]|nr:XRE family transcriptional regulator [Erysipelotrichia bacterium]
MNPADLGKRIRTLRKERGMTQAQLADRLGVTFQAVSKWENGRSVPDVLMLREISALFGTDLNAMLDGKEPKPAEKKPYWIIAVIAAALILLAGYLQRTRKRDYFEFRTLSSGCSAFNISGSLASGSDQSYLYISDITYCGEEDHTKYRRIQCSLYEGDTVLDTDVYEGSEPTALIEYLKGVRFMVNQEKDACTVKPDSVLQIEIQAVNEAGTAVGYTIPVTSADTCSSTDS